MPLKPLKWYKNLATKKGRLEAGAFLVEGDRAIKQIIGTHPDEIIEIIAIEKPSPAYHNYSIRYVTDSQFRSISQTKTPQGIIAVVRLPRNTLSDHLPENIGTKILLLEDIQDPGNVGTLIRTAAAFNFSGVILSNKCADPLSQKCIQSTAGTVLSVWIRKTTHYLEFIEVLKKIGYFLVAADLNGVEDPSILSR
jgi:TrmH family RNA methyltransferase